MLSYQLGEYFCVSGTGMWHGSKNFDVPSKKCAAPHWLRYPAGCLQQFDFFSTCTFASVHNCLN